MISSRSHPTRAIVCGVASRPPAAAPIRRATHVRLAVMLMVFVSVAGCGASRVAGPAGPVEPPATELPPNYAVEYDPEFQTPRHVSNTQTIGSAHPGAPAPFSDPAAFQIVRRFVIRYAAVFLLRPGIDDFAVISAKGRDGLNFVKIQQTYYGLKVDVMSYGTSVLPNGSVGSMIGRFMPGIGVSTKAHVSATAAGAKSIDALSPRVVHLTSPPTLLITTHDKVPRLAWSAIVNDGSFSSWKVLVDAHDGAVLAVLSNFIVN